MKTSLLLCALALVAPAAIAAGKAIPSEQLPEELRPFVEPGRVVIGLAQADLDGDGSIDAILVLEQEKQSDEEEGERTLLILTRHADNRLTVAKRSDKAVLCRQCGGVIGDPFAGVEAGPGVFALNHQGGSAWRWTKNFKFSYSKRDQTWQLNQAEEVSFQAGDPKKSMKKEVLKPPKDFGKIDIADFDAQEYRGKGQR
jgi:hypothetical protein